KPFMERPWMPFTLLRVHQVRLALAKGCSFNYRLNAHPLTPPRASAHSGKSRRTFDDVNAHRSPPLRLHSPLTSAPADLGGLKVGNDRIVIAQLIPTRAANHAAGF